MSVLNSTLGSGAWSERPDVRGQPDSANETPSSQQVASAARRSSGTDPGLPAPRVRTADVERVRERMTGRDWQIVREVNRLRAATGQQLERLYFAEVQVGRSRIATRSRALGRLVRWRVLVPVGRRIGGRQRGSSAQAYALDRVGQRLLRNQQLAAGERVRVRRPVPPGPYAIRHLLAVAEVYVTLVEQARASGVVVAEFRAEPGSYWPNGRGGWLKPDAYVVLERPGVRDHHWIEVDMATESLPVIRGKLQAYVDFQRRGEAGPDDIMPWVLVATVSKRRREAIQAVVWRLPGAGELVRVVLDTEAAETMLGILRE